MFTFRPDSIYYTAVDDVVRASDDATGAGMIGTVEMASSTLYRYANINLDALNANLGDASVSVEATLAFVRAFIESMPTGKPELFRCYAPCLMRLSYPFATIAPSPM